jgi:hypothetical protein
VACKFRLWHSAALLIDLSLPKAKQPILLSHVDSCSAVMAILTMSNISPGSLLHSSQTVELAAPYATRVFDPGSKQSELASKTERCSVGCCSFPAGERPSAA